jgi:hypothetical protein
LFAPFCAKSDVWRVASGENLFLRPMTVCSMEMGQNRAYTLKKVDEIQGNVEKVQPPLSNNP